MTTRIFRLTALSAKYLENLPAGEGLVIVKPERKLEQELEGALHKVWDTRADVTAVFQGVISYFSTLTADPACLELVDREVNAIAHYVSEGIVYRPSFDTIRDYVMARCARLCATLVHARIGGTFIDGTDLMVCSEGHGGLYVNWEESMVRVKARLSAPGLYVLSCGYGRTPAGYCMSLGRKGEDLMAMSVASALSADKVEVYVTDDDILFIPAVSYEEAAVFCGKEEGAVAPAALLPVMKAGIPVIVKDIRDLSRFCRISSDKPSTDKIITGFLVEDDLSLLNLRGTSLVGKVGISSAIFGALARGGVNIRLISQPSSEFCISIAVEHEDLPAALEALKTLYSGGQVGMEESLDVEEYISILSVCGNRMKNVPGTSGKVFSALGEAGVNIVSAAQGGDELSISIVIRTADKARALSALEKL